MQVEGNAAPLFHRRCDGGEVVIREHHRGRFACNGRATGPHGDADVGLAQGGGIVDAIAGHGDDVTAALKAAHQL